MGKGNPNPRLENLKRYPRIVPEGTCRKPVQVKISVNQYDLWMSIPAKERNESLRQFIADKLVEKKLLPSN